VTLLLNHKLVSRAKLCLVCVFPDIVKDYPKIILFLRFPKKFRECGPWIPVIKTQYAPDGELAAVFDIPSPSNNKSQLKAI